MRNLLRSYETQSKWPWEIEETQMNLFSITLDKGRKVGSIIGRKGELEESSC
jgi:hypothetical protein